MTDSADAIARIDAVQTLITGSAARLTGPAGKAAKAAVMTVAAELGPLSNMGRKGVKLNSGYDLADGGATLIVKLRPPGAWVITEKKSKAHVIAPRRRRRTGSGRPPAVAGNWGHPAQSVEHPGGRGRKGITRAFARARPVISETVHREQVRAMESIFGG